MQNPKDAVYDAAIIETLHVARLVRQHRPDGSPFKISEFVAHDSKLQSRSLNHDSATDLNTFPVAIARPLSGRYRN
jgi:hypothetical protein